MPTVRSLTRLHFSRPRCLPFEFDGDLLCLILEAYMDRRLRPLHNDLMRALGALTFPPFFS